MYALTYKKKSNISKLLFLVAKHKWLVLSMMLGLYQFSDGLYIFAKAELAQYLIANAWHKNLTSAQQHKPWPWADTHPVAELIIKDKNWYVLAGASGRNLAFAPTHLSSTPEPGKMGNSVIVGHRDTQFNSLKRLQKGDIIEIKTKHKHQQFKVTMLRIAVYTDLEYLQDNTTHDTFDEEQSSLTLITCYPFDSVLPNPTHRYIVRAMAI
ncbi:class GN sortase [uncultured Paraglaciecola sp.]|uniref:class GN sortase n=1 Tax=uncultured Paraglaciecola sp. TaxID=1765024 RepID=UPI0030DB78CB|tara:strand:+ start:192042 stop:192671 length:630 start_codon:yes stop_codon:yes gene_type:complete